MRIADLMANLSLSTEEFSNGLHRAVSEARSASRQIADAFSGAPANSIDSLCDKLKHSTRQMGNDFKDVKRIVSGIMISQAFYRSANAIQKAVDSIRDYNMELEQTRIAFRYLVGSQEKANRYMKAMQQFAAVTPFTTKSAAEASKMLMSMGFAANQTLPVLKILSDASAVSGADPETFKRIVYAIGQIKTSGRLMKQDLMQLASAGIPVFQILREELGLTQKQLDNLGKNHISSDAALSAIFKGLQKRYKGASDEISDTTRGMLSTIKDNLYIIGNALTEGIAGKTKNAVRKIRDGLNEARSIIDNAGVGGLINRLFPPEMHVQIRAFMGYISALIQSIGRLLRSLSPVSAELFNAFVITFNAAAPVIISFLNILTSMLSVISRNTVLVRTLALSMIWLTISVKIASMVRNLSMAIRGLGIAGYVARLVVNLAKSVRVFYVALTSHPIVAVITIIAAGLLSLALSSKTVTAWIDRLTASLGRLFGFKAEDMWKPVDPGKANDDLQEFYNGLGKVDKSFKDVGNSADKAGKKGAKAGKQFKDKFIASFDEVHKIPEALKKASDAVNDGFGGGPKLDNELNNMKLPKLPNYDNKNKHQQVLPPFKWPKIPPFIWPKIPPFPGWPAMPAIPVPDIKAWFNEVIEKLGRALEGIRNKLRVPWPAPSPLKVPDIQLGKSWEDTKNSIRSWGQDVISGIDQVLDNVRSVCVNTGNAISGSLSNVPDVIGGALESVTGLTTGVATAFGSVRDVIGGSVENACRSIDGFAARLAASRGLVAQHMQGIAIAISGGFSVAMAAVASWTTTCSSTISSWSSAALNTIGAFVKETSTEVATWSSGIISSVINWTSGALSSIGNFTTGTSSSIVSFVGTTAANIVGWTTSTGSLIKDWCSNHKKEIGIATAVTATALAAWATGGLSTIGEFVTGAGSSIAAWVASSGGSIKLFTSNAAAKILEWINKSGPDIGHFASGATGNIKAGTLAWLGSISAFIGVAGPKIKEWTSRALNNISSWKTNSVNHIKTGCSSMMSHINTFKSGAVQNFSRLWSSVQSGTSSAWSRIASSLGSSYSRLLQHASRFRSSFVGVFNGIGHAVSAAFSTIGSMVGRVMRPVIRGMNSLIGGLNSFRIDVPDWVPSIGGRNFGFNLPYLPVPGFKNGGIIDKEGLIRIGEGNRREMVVPLQNPSAMQPFADAIASRIQPQLQSNNPTYNNAPPQILYVGTLIADEKSLTELERKMKVIRMKEGRR